MVQTNKDDKPQDNGNVVVEGRRERRNLIGRGRANMQRRRLLRHLSNENVDDIDERGDDERLVGEPNLNVPPQDPQPQDPAERFAIALRAAQDTINEASQIEAVTKTQVKIARSLNDARLRMETVRRQEQWDAATQALEQTLAASRQLIASRSAVEKRTQVQAESYESLQPIMDRVKKTYFNNEGGSKSIEEENLRPGKEFGGYLTALTTVEKMQTGAKPYETASREDKQRAAAELTKAAQAYLDHYDERYLSEDEQKKLDREDLPEEERKALQKKVKPDEKALRKRQIAEEGFKGARHLGLALDFEALGGAPRPDAPWSQTQDIRLNQIKSQLAFETGYKKASKLEGGGVNASYWIESTETSPTGQNTTPKQFLFKPKDKEQGPGSDYEKFGILGVKESLASATSKIVAEQTGLDLGVPETSVATVGGFAIEGGKRGEVQQGSIQQFEKTDGELRDQDPSIYNSIPKEEWHRVAIQDIVSVNCDRHGGNFMVKRGRGGETSKLVPIDHGSSLPTPSDFENVSQDLGGFRAMGSVQNVTLKQPASYEPFSQDMLDAISRLDPDGIADHMREHVASLDEVNPGLDGQKLLPDESIELSRRTAKFLKAAAPFMSSAEIMVAIHSNREEFTDFEKDIDDVCQRVIDKQLPLKGVIQQMMTGPDDGRQELVALLKKNGWDANGSKVADLIRTSPDIAWQLATRNIKNVPPGRNPAEAVNDTTPQLGIGGMIEDTIQDIERLYGSCFADIDANFPARKAVLTARRELATAVVADDGEANALLWKAAAFRTSYINAILEFYDSDSKRIHDQIVNLVEGDTRAQVEMFRKNVVECCKGRNYNPARQSWRQLLPLAKTVAERPEGEPQRKLDDAQEYIQQQVPRGEQVLTQATQRLTDLRALAADVVNGLVTGRLTGGSRADAMELRAAGINAENSAGQFARDIEEAKRWADDVYRIFNDKLPRDSELTPKLAAVKKKLDTLALKVRADVDGAEKLDKKIRDAVEIVDGARERQPKVNELLARLIAADQHTAFLMLSKAGALQSSASVDIKSLSENLAAAQAEGVSDDEKARLIAICRGLMRDVVGKLNSLREQLTQTRTLEQVKLNNYPQNLDRQAEPFVKPFAEWAKIDQGLRDLDMSRVELERKARDHGQTLVRLM
jgi:hypothetical protein